MTGRGLQRDYRSTGLTIQQAMLDHVKNFKSLERPKHILWNGLQVKTSDEWEVPYKGVIQAEMISASSNVKQGFDIKVDGWLELAEFERVPLLRTWRDSQLPDCVEYSFTATGRRLWIWNVYEMYYPGGDIIEEKWTENAGFWIEELGERVRVYHCSDGMSNPPSFDALVLKVSVCPK